MSVESWVYRFFLTYFLSQLKPDAFFGALCSGVYGAEPEDHLVVSGSAKVDRLGGGGNEREQWGEV